jgi:hypothetical protein
MNLETVNFAPLKRYSFVFRLYIWLKRLRMILVRLLIIALLLYLLTSKEVSISYSSENPLYLNPIFWIFVWVTSNMILFNSISKSWNNFASSNGFIAIRKNTMQIGRNSTLKEMTVPSFKGKLLGFSAYPVIGEVESRKFGFFTRLYKEGGIFRWRERKMDTVLWVHLKKRMPHIVVDSKFNERARRSNLSISYSNESLINFEGSTGDKYFDYSAPGNQIATLQLFTPDVLEVLFDRIPTVDIEMKGKRVWFVNRYAVLNDKVAKEMFSAVLEFMSEIDKQIESARFTQEQLDADIV